MNNALTPRVVSGKLLSPQKTPVEAVADLRTYFDELAKHQEFIAMAWCKHYGTKRLGNPIDSRMRSSMVQVSTMVMLVESNLRAIENHLNTVSTRLQEVRHA
ncbi:hypothetical protein WCT90_15710 [Pectobacterium carotovorum]|uniref:hypothetical protein n=1 Tax=Pectobacterium carotovorum TaxID=554 RepID=UPI0030195ED6